MAEKPLRADARRNRARVLDAAREAFAADGLAVPLDEIARRAGVGPGTVYRHFPTKEALFEAVITEHTEELIAQARAGADADDAGAVFFAFLAKLGEAATAKKDLTDALSVAGVDVDAAVSSPARELTDAVSVLLVRAQRAGAVRSDIEITDLILLLKGALAAIQGGPDTGDVRRDRILAVLSDGLRS